MPPVEHPAGRDLATRLFEKFKGRGYAAHIADALGINRNTVYLWQSRECIPAYMTDRVRALLGDGPPPGK